MIFKNVSKLWETLLFAFRPATLLKKGLWRSVFLFFSFSVFSLNFVKHLGILFYGIPSRDCFWNNLLATNYIFLLTTWSQKITQSTKNWKLGKEWCTKLSSLKYTKQRKYKLSFSKYFNELWPNYERRQNMYHLIKI